MVQISTEFLFINSWRPAISTAGLLFHSFSSPLVKAVSCRSAALVPHALSCRVLSQSDHPQDVAVDAFASRAFS